MKLKLPRYPFIFCGIITWICSALAMTAYWSPRFRHTISEVVVPRASTPIRRTTLATNEYWDFHTPNATKKTIDILLGIPSMPTNSTLSWIRKQQYLWKSYRPYQMLHVYEVLYFVGECHDSDPSVFEPTTCRGQTSAIMWDLNGLRDLVGKDRLVVLENFNDGYYKMGHKVLLMLMWAHQYYNFKWFVKLDPDTFLHVPRLMQTLAIARINHGDPLKKRLYLGYYYPLAPTHTEGKWRNVRWQNRFLGSALSVLYAPYHSGESYIFSYLAVEFLKKIDPFANDLYIDQNDDAGIGFFFITLRDNPVKHINIRSFCCHQFYSKRCDGLMNSLPKPILVKLKRMLDSDEKAKKING